MSGLDNDAGVLHFKLHDTYQKNASLHTIQARLYLQAVDSDCPGTPTLLLLGKNEFFLLRIAEKDKKKQKQSPQHTRELYHSQLDTLQDAMLSSSALYKPLFLTGPISGLRRGVQFFIWLEHASVKTVLICQACRGTSS